MKFWMENKLLDKNIYCFPTIYKKLSSVQVIENSWALLS